MFGHQDDQDNHHHHDDDQKPMEDVLSGPVVDSVLSTEEHGSTVVTSSDSDDHFNPALPLTTDDQPHDTAPVVDEVVAPAVHSPVLDSPVNDDLLSIKQQALTQLSPLVGHLDQSPEEKFRTTMMMIQASDNHDLIKVAYEAAQVIEDEKVKAQALLDIVNEINYFTQQSA